jgi:hypothetical protein
VSAPASTNEYTTSCEQFQQFRRCLRAIDAVRRLGSLKPSPAKDRIRSLGQNLFGDNIADAFHPKLGGMSGCPFRDGFQQTDEPITDHVRLTAPTQSVDELEDLIVQLERLLALERRNPSPRRPAGSAQQWNDLAGDFETFILERVAMRPARNKLLRPNISIRRPNAAPKRPLCGQCQLSTSVQP